MSRWRLIPTRGTRGSRFIHGDADAVLTEGEAVSVERGCKVLVVEHPEGGRVRTLATVGENPPRLKKERTT